jgi:hypothetical protein
MGNRTLTSVSKLESKLERVESPKRSLSSHKQWCRVQVKSIQLLASKENNLQVHSQLCELHTFNQVLKTQM